MKYFFGCWECHDSQHCHTDSRWPLANVDGVPDTVNGTDKVEK